MPDWSHQLRTNKAILDAIAAGHKKILVTGPTGAGKSRIMFDHIKHHEANRGNEDAWTERRGLVVHTDRRMLCDQLSANMEAHGIDHGRIAAGHSPKLAPVQLAMMQTIHRQSVVGGRTLHDADTIIWDECVARGTMVETDSGSVPIEQVRAGQLVLSADQEGPKFSKVTRKWDVGVRRIVSVLTFGGTHIRCTHDHLFYTQRGWVQACQLKTTDCIASVDVESVQSRGGDSFLGTTFEASLPIQKSQRISVRQSLEACWVIQASRMETGIQKCRGLQQITPISRLSGRPIKRIFLPVLGQPLESSRMAGMGTSWPQCKPSHVGCWSQSTNLRMEAEESELRESGWMGSVTSAWHGGSAMMGLSHHEGCFCIPTPTIWKSKKYSSGGLKAGTVERFLFCRQRANTGSSTSGRNVQRRWGSESESTYQTACSTSWKAVKSVQDVGCERVYDLTVEGTHCYYADGLLVHNCHKMVGPSAMRLRDKYGDDVVDIGFTATPLGVGMYEHMIEIATVSELQKAGVLVKAYHFGPDEPDPKQWKVSQQGKGESALHTSVRMQFAQKVWGNVIKNYYQLNPTKRPTLLFAPGVPESIWFAKMFEKAGLNVAHVDGEKIYVDGEFHDKKQEPDKINELKARLCNGDLDVVTNRFVMREGVDWPFIEHIIFATVFGSLTSYLQAGGRGLRQSPDTGKTHLTVQCHGSNWHRHGSLNADRHWFLGQTDSLAQSMRFDRLREKREQEPIVCYDCGACRLGGIKCWNCGHVQRTKIRRVLQIDGTLREMRGDIYRQRRRAKNRPEYRSAWVGYMKGVMRSDKPAVRNANYLQLEYRFAKLMQDRFGDFVYPRRDWPCTPKLEIDYFLPISRVKEFV